MKTATQAQIVPFDPSLREGVRALLRATYGDAEAFDRYADGNPLGPFLAVCAVREAKVVGFNIWNPWLMHTARGPVTALQSGASIVDASCRGQGVFGNLLAAGEDLARARGIRYFVGFPNPSSHKAFVRAGWETVRSLGLYFSAVPSLAAPRFAPQVPREETDAWRFLEWRYARRGASFVDVSIGGSPLRAYYRSTRQRGIHLHRLLDLVNRDGRRDLQHLARIAAHLPAPGVVYLRASASRTCELPPLPWLVPLRRDWDTPYLFKALDRSDPAEADDVRNALLAYGDIDVG